MTLKVLVFMLVSLQTKVKQGTQHAKEKKTHPRARVHSVPHAHDAGHPHNHLIQVACPVPPLLGCSSITPGVTGFHLSKVDPLAETLLRSAQSFSLLVLNSETRRKTPQEAWLLLTPLQTVFNFLWVSWKTPWFQPKR